MTLYHGSSQIVREPRIIQPKRTLDYGAGFYTTTSEKQAHDWALRRIVGDERGYGPVANDRVYAAFALYEQGLLSKQELIAELKQTHRPDGIPY